jgi:hypothetical protein
LKAIRPWLCESFDERLEKVPTMQAGRNCGRGARFERKAHAEFRSILPCLVGKNPRFTESPRTHRAGVPDRPVSGVTVWEINGRRVTGLKAKQNRRLTQASSTPSDICW